jgi:hypothetical protein
VPSCVEIVLADCCATTTGTRRDARLCFSTLRVLLLQTSSRLTLLVKSRRSSPTPCE